MENSFLAKSSVPILLGPKATIVIRPFDGGFAIESQYGHVIASVSGVDYSSVNFSLQPMPASEGGGTVFQAFWTEYGQS